MSLEEPSVTSVFAIAQIMFSNKMPTDKELTEEEADILAHNAELGARALLKRPFGVAYVLRIEKELEEQ